jgi:uncharacterized membrane protein
MSTLRASWSQPDARRAAVLAAALAFVLSWALLHTGFYSHGALVDTPTYQGYAEQVRAGGLPYRDFALEYPPGALAVFLPPSWAGSYADAFGWLMALLGVACVVLVALAGARPWGVAFVAVSPLLAGSLLLSRYDLWPAALAAAAMAALLADRHRLGWAALGAAFAAKLYPAVLVPLALAWTWRRRGPRAAALAAAAGAAVALAAFGLFLVAAPHGLWESVRGQLSRPLQVESLAASALTTFGDPATETSHGSQNVVGHGTLAALSAAAGLAALAALWAAFALGPAERGRLTRYAAACVCAFVVFGKVLSPQYLVWLVPLVPLVRGRRGVAATALLAAALLTTQAWFPKRYWGYALEWHLAWVVLARNLLLVALLCVLALSPPGRGRARSS